eukprot:m.160116 g.160116  ORF g.160116 m.160116 type:complete len:245 (-) comp17620_c0_seq2:1959-2693(-)
MVQTEGVAAAAQPVGKEVVAPFVVAVAGGSCSGKSTVCRDILDGLSAKHGDRVHTLKLSLFYKDLSDQPTPNYDHPDSLDWDRIVSVVSDLKHRKAVSIPQNYDKKSSTPGPLVELEARDVILLDGIFALFHRELRALADLMIFVELDSDTRLARRVTRDMSRGRPLEDILMTYTNDVKPSFDEFIMPTKRFADVIIPRGSTNKVAISMLLQHIQAILDGAVDEKHLPSEESGRRNSASMARPH